jgi:hypothetical protein
MPNIEQTSLFQQTQQEPLRGLRCGPQTSPVSIATSLLEHPPVQVAFPLAHASLLLGVAENRLPLLIDLYDPTPGPLLVAGDGGGGKTILLQSLALGSDFQDPGEILFGVVTPFPEEWSGLEILSNCLGIWPAYHLSARHFLTQLVSWANVLPGTRQVVVLMVDGLDLLITNGFHDQNDLRWLLTYGPRRQIWPVISINPGRLPRPETWLEYFQTIILGQIKRPQTIQLLGVGSEVDPSYLSQKGQYGLWQHDCLVKFHTSSK